MCQFTIAFKQDAESIIQRAKHEIGKVGGSLTGDASTGEFQVKTPIGSIEGAYKVEAQEMFFSIAKKPFLLSCSQIEKELSKLVQ